MTEYKGDHRISLCDPVIIQKGQQCNTQRMWGTNTKKELQEISDIIVGWKRAHRKLVGATEPILA